VSGFVETGRSVVRRALERVGRGWSKMQERRPLSYDLLESDDAYLVVFDAPGVRGEDLNVTFLDHTVEVELDRFRDFYDGYEMLFPGRGVSLSGSADLPRDANVTPQGERDAHAKRNPPGEDPEEGRCARRGSRRGGRRGKRFDRRHLIPAQSEFPFLTPRPGSPPTSLRDVELFVPVKSIGIERVDPRRVRILSFDPAE